MAKNKDFFMGVLVSIVVMFSLLLLTGAVNNKTPNYSSNMRNLTNYNSIHVACSSDGNIVYIADAGKVMRSKDFGENWQTVITSNNKESTQQ